MKFFMRVKKLVVVLSVLMVMVAGSAWGASYTYGVDIKLDSTGRRMDVHLTFLRDGQRFPIYDILNDAQLAELSKVFAMRMDIRPSGSSTVRYTSVSPIILDKYSQKATFVFPQEFEEGEYFLVWAGSDAEYNSEFASLPQGQKDAFYANVERMGSVTFEEVMETLLANFALYSDINQTVTIKKESASTVPGAPTDVTATAGDRQAAVSFRAPTDNGGSAITSYIVTSNPGSVTATGTTTSITVTGLTNGTTYTFTVRAANSVGTGAASAASNSVTPTGGGGGSSSGCNTGFGIVGLLLAGLVTRKYRRA